MREEFAKKFKNYQNVSISFDNFSYEPFTKTSRFNSKSVTKEHKDFLKKFADSYFFAYRAFHSKFILTLSPDVQKLIDKEIKALFLVSEDNGKISLTNKSDGYSRSAFHNVFVSLAPIGGLTYEKMMKLDKIESLVSLRDSASIPGHASSLSILIKKILQRMITTPKWDEKLLFYALALNEFMRNGADKTFAEYIEENEEYLYDNVFMKFKTVSNDEIFDKVEAFYSAIVLHQANDVNSPKIFETMEKLTHKEWTNVIEFTYAHFCSEKRIKLHLTFKSPTNYRAFNTTKNSQIFTDYINFAKKQTNYSSTYHSDLLEELWNKVKERDKTTDSEIVDVIYDAWIKVAASALNHKSAHDKKTYSFQKVMLLNDHKKDFETIPQLFAAASMMFNGQAFYRSSLTIFDNNVMEPRKSKIVIKVFKHYETDFSKFMKFLEHLTYEYSGVLPTPTEWEAGCKTLDIDNLNEISLHLLHSMIKIYNKPVKNVGKIVNPYKKIREVMNK